MAAIPNPYAERQSFEKTKSEIEFPDLLSVQVDAFQGFIQENVPEDERLKVGLEEVFSNYFPIEDSHRNYVLEYKNYFLGLAKYTPEECIDRGLTLAKSRSHFFSSALRCTDGSIRTRSAPARRAWSQA